MNFRQGVVAVVGWILGVSAFAAHAQTVEYVHTDALGTPIAITDASGAVIERSEYDPYGALLNRPITDGPGFTGHVQDAATGLTYMQQRYYDPLLGRFLSVDPVGAFEGPRENFNRFWYAAGNPYRYKDPDGRCIFPGHPGCGRTLEVIQAQEKVKEEQKAEAEKVSKAADNIGKKANALPSTIVGLVVASPMVQLTVLTGGKPKVSLGNNAIQVSGIPKPMAGAITLGNVIIYSEGSGGPNYKREGNAETLGQEEMKHTFQAERLGPLNLPVHILSKVIGYGVDGTSHGSADFMERGIHNVKKEEQ